MVIEEGTLQTIIKNLRKRQSTLLGVSPVSEYTIISALKAASKLNAPIVFVTSLNQVDIDGGYTGFTPGKFVKYVERVIKIENLDVKVLFQLDHCGPWLKDDHIAKRYNYNEALDKTLSSMEAFIRAGFNLLHIDTTIDVENTSGLADLETAIKRTVYLIDLAEDIASSLGIEVKYEIGSDRWGFKPVDTIDTFVSHVFSMLKGQNIDPRKIVFTVADVGTKVRPGNKVHEEVLEMFSRTALKHNCLLKIHSGDYLENPGSLPRLNVGGINIGPMFADIQYRVVKKAIMDIEKPELLDRLNSLIQRGDKIGKYVRKEKVEDYEMGLASRYIWSSPEAQEIINVIEKHGVPISRLIIDDMVKVIEFYLRELNLQNFFS